MRHAVSAAALADVLAATIANLTNSSFVNGTNATFVNSVNISRLEQQLASFEFRRTLQEEVALPPLPCDIVTRYVDRRLCPHDYVGSNCTDMRASCDIQWDLGDAECEQSAGETSGRQILERLNYGRRYSAIEPPCRFVKRQEKEAFQ